jgi:hypothetical protein
MDRLTASQNAHDLEGMLACFMRTIGASGRCTPRALSGDRPSPQDCSALLQSIPDLTQTSSGRRSRGTLSARRFAGPAQRPMARIRGAWRPHHWHPRRSHLLGGACTQRKWKVRTPTRRGGQASGRYRRSIDATPTPLRRCCMSRKAGGDRPLVVSVQAGTERAQLGGECRGLRLSQRQLKAERGGADGAREIGAAMV